MLCPRWILVATALAALPNVWQAGVFAQKPAVDGSSAQTPPPPTKPDEIEILIPPATETKVEPASPKFQEVKIPNFASCPLAELRQTIPELAHLQAAEDQSQLAALLDRIGAKTVEIAHKTPNLISDETVVSERGGIKTRKDFSFLVLRHTLGSKGVVFDEFRVDIKSGEKFQTEELEKAASSSAAPSSSPLNLLSVRRGLPDFEEAAPASQGFVNDWLHFYPSNRQESEFRYLGLQKMAGRHTLVVAFAQKSGSVRLPAMVGFENKVYPIFMQGVAWVDASDFKIVRLRTDLLVPPPGVPLRQLTADIQFAQTAIAEIASPLWLPRLVIVTTSLSEVTLRESHTYSKYRLFRAQSRLLLNP